MDKFTVKRVYPELVTFRRIAVRSETYDLIEHMKDEAGMPWVDLMDAMATFCAERLNVVEDDK